MTMNAIFQRLMVPPVATPAPPPKNEFRCYAVPMEGVGLGYLQNILDLDIQKFIWDFEDEDTKGWSVEQLLCLDKIIPHEAANVVMTSREYDQLLYYVEDRMRRMATSERSLLVLVSVETLYNALKSLRESLIHYTEVAPLNRLRA